jgi:hypothetical protein
MSAKLIICKEYNEKRVMQCTNCGAKMPDGSVFCQACGHKMVSDTNQHSQIQHEQKNLSPISPSGADSSSQLLNHLNYLFRKSGAISKKITQNVETGLENMTIIISGGIRIIFASINLTSMSDSVMENLVLQKFRFDATAIFLMEGEAKMKPMGSEVINKLSRNAIIIKNEREIGDKIKAIPDGLSEYNLLTRVMEIFGINQSDENSFVLQAKGGNEISAMADSLREKIKFLKKKNNNP